LSFAGLAVVIGPGQVEQTPHSTRQRRRPRNRPPLVGCLKRRLKLRPVGVCDRQDMEGGRNGGRFAQVQGQLGVESAAEFESGEVRGPVARCAQSPMRQSCTRGGCRPRRNRCSRSARGRFGGCSSG
jgi:hypothetical protein